MSHYVKIPHLPVGKVGLAVAGERYKARLSAAFEKLNMQIVWLPDSESTDLRLAGHADLRLVHLGGSRLVSACGTEIDGIFESLGFTVVRSRSPGAAYPDDCRLNVCIVGCRLFHRLDITAGEVLSNLPDVTHIGIAQGYAKCCTCIVDANTIITSDRGIASAAEKQGVDVLEIAPGYICLDGFDYGFIGGASFKLSEREIAFTGRLEQHPDWPRMVAFLGRKGVKPVFLTDETAFDIGSVLPLIEI